MPHLDSFPRYTPEWIINLTGNADLCALLDQRELVPALYADLLPFADRQAIGGAHTPSRGPVALYLGKLARLLEDWEAAHGHLHTALQLCAAMGSPPFEAITLLGLLDVLGLALIPSDDRPPAAIVIGGAVLGLITLIGVSLAWRDRRGGLVTVVASRLLSALLGVPAFFVDGPDMGPVVAGVGIALTLVGVALIFWALRRPQFSSSVT